MQRFVTRILNVFLILLIFSPIFVTNASETDDEIESVVSLLQQLRSVVSSLPNEAFGNIKLGEMKRNTLCNKINAVIKQVMAGAYDGALNKLSNDLENYVMKCSVNPWRDDLFDLIEGIIESIEGIECIPPVDSNPPVIHGVLQYPDMPEYDDSVLVLAHVTEADDCHDCHGCQIESGVANVTLSYSVDSGKSINLTMHETDGLYEAEIPAQLYNTTVSFLVYAWDNAGNVAVSAAYYYVVGDSRPPVISYIEHVPASPNYNETVSVYVNATEPSSASGVRKVFLTYDNGTAWMNVTLSFQDGLYVTVIPELPYGTVVQYRVSALDNAGNEAVMDIYSYVMDDRFMPLAKIEAPSSGSYLSGDVDIEVYAYDDNFAGAELTANETLLASWSEAGSYTYVWNTTELSDGFYVLKLDVCDEAGNMGKTESLVLVDNTAPTVKLSQPKDGSYVRRTVFVELSAEDLDLDRMELEIAGSTYTWRVGGSYTYIWETSDYDDGLYGIVLVARDKAGNEMATSVSVTVDNTAPSLNNLMWTPSEPVAGEKVNLSVQVFEHGSGVRNVTLWFTANTSKWEPLDMRLQDNNWTCEISGQEADVTALFYVKCFDNAGNFAATKMETYTVKGEKGYVSGFPLGWLLLIIAVIGAAAALGVYFFKFRKKTA